MTDTAHIENIEMIMRQTDYTAEVAEQKLKECNNNAISVIRNYINPSGNTTSPSKTLSVNQQIYKEIRTMMDDAAKNYELSKQS